MSDANGFDEIHYAGSRGIILEYSNSGMTKKNIDSWPCKGSKMIFLNENGYDSEREHARKTFKDGQFYSVESVHIGRSSSSIAFKGIPGQWNSVMFEEVE